MSHSLLRRHDKGGYNTPTNKCVSTADHGRKAIHGIRLLGCGSQSDTREEALGSSDEGGFKNVAADEK
uniref:Uncharacterized protein n=1 Tax=Toxoplasma gondii COUG TaxID=1074873 RepID=A0A2G8XX51_TOXGO|nr:hypothetical protein TGCOUG_394070 [Toxoplasma gondii COUG]